jgi:hypothetical protein
MTGHTKKRKGRLMDFRLRLQARLGRKLGQDRPENHPQAPLHDTGHIRARLDVCSGPLVGAIDRNLGFVACPKGCHLKSKRPLIGTSHYPETPSVLISDFPRLLTLHRNFQIAIHVPGLPYVDRARSEP